MADQSTEEAQTQTAGVEEREPTQQQNASQQQSVSGQETSQDKNNAKAIGVVGYIIPILFFLPLVTDMKDNDFAMHHANQQLNLLLYWVIANIVGQLLLVVLIGIVVLPIVWIFGIILMIMGIINVVNEEKKPLPLIGGFSLLK